MRITFWGTRGSIPTPGPGTARHGGNTACVELRPNGRSGPEDPLVVLDAGTGIAALGRTLLDRPRRVDILLSHLHLDHILGLGFFEPLFREDAEVHIWGPSSTTLDLRMRLNRYLSPPLFPVSLRELPCELVLHDVPLDGEFEVPGVTVRAALVCHPGPTVGYRFTSAADGATLAYLSDHEPALGNPSFPGPAAWTSGAGLAEGVDVLVHDAQYADDEYPERVGWGHSSVSAAVAFADLVGARRLVAFHHDPAHDDATLDRLLDLRLANGAPVVAAQEGQTVEAAPTAATATTAAATP